MTQPATDSVVEQGLKGLDYHRNRREYSLFCWIAMQADGKKMLDRGEEFHEQCPGDYDLAKLGYSEDDGQLIWPCQCDHHTDDEGKSWGKNPTI